MAASAEKLFSHYRMRQPIGKGDIGEVYQAEDVQNQQQIAAKIIRVTTIYPNQEAAVKALPVFTREVSASAKLEHPNILRPLDHGEATLDGSPITYLIMPYHAEGSLINWLNQKAKNQLTPQQIIHIVRQASAALEYAHDRQILHLDVKPTNFLIHSRSTVDEYPDLLLSDFGSARLISAAASSSQHGPVTTTYIAPEQFNNQPVAASDQYALGIMAYELLTGSPPFQGPPESVKLAHTREKPRLVRDLVPMLPPTVDPVLQRALAKEPKERFPSIATFAQAFQAALRDAPATATTRRTFGPPTPMPPMPEAPLAKGDIRATLLISAQEARYGAARVLTLPDGRKINVQIPVGAQADQVLVLNGQGETPAPNAAPGALYLTLSIATSPAQLAAAQNDVTIPVRDFSPAVSRVPAPLTPLVPPPASIHPPVLPPSQGQPIPPPATPRPNMPAPSLPLSQSGLPMSPPATPRPNMPAPSLPLSQSGLPMSPPATPRPNMPQPNPVSRMPLPPSQGSFSPQNPRAFASEPASTKKSKRTYLLFAIVAMMLMLVAGIGINAYSTIASNLPFLNGQPTPVPTSSGVQATMPTAVPGASQVWQSQISGTSQKLISVTWADTRFVAVGSQGTVLTSPDGHIWTPQNSGTKQDLWSISWSGNLLTAVGTGGTVITSPNGTLWTVQHSGTTQDLWNVIWADGSVFVAAGTGGTILSSRDGHTWTDQQAHTGQILDGFAWSGNLLIAVGTGGAILASNDDGSTWVVQNSGSLQFLEGASWLNNQFVAVGTNGTILTSPNGTTWTTRPSSVTESLSGIDGSASRLVIVGNNGTILTSPDGRSWTPQRSGTSQALVGIGRSPTLFVVVGDKGTILTAS
ncbi:MAG TPA: protein kinase [Ktedonobacteraceae bacterium]|nr:protein kinase [Ktedonobacteraceae bacterium]